VFPSHELCNKNRESTFSPVLNESVSRLVVVFICFVLFIVLTVKVNTNIYRDLFYVNLENIFFSAAETIIN
jgi:hypothetical protein